MWEGEAPGADRGGTSIRSVEGRLWARGATLACERCEESGRICGSGTVCLCGGALQQQNAEEWLEESQALSRLEEVC